MDVGHAGAPAQPAQLRGHSHAGVAEYHHWIEEGIDPILLDDSPLTVAFDTDQRPVDGDPRPPCGHHVCRRALSISPQHPAFRK